MIIIIEDQSKLPNTNSSLLESVRLSMLITLNIFEGQHSINTFPQFQSYSLSGGLHIVARKISLYSIENALTPAILNPAGEVDDIALLKHQVPRLACVIVI